MKTVEKTKITINPETNLEITVRVLLVHPKKTQEGFKIKASRTYYVRDKAPHYVVQVLRDNRLLHEYGSAQEHLTRSIEEYTRFIREVTRYAEMLAWREQNPDAHYDLWPDRFLDGRKGFGGGWMKFPRFQYC